MDDWAMWSLRLLEEGFSSESYYMNLLYPSRECEIDVTLPQVLSLSSAAGPAGQSPRAPRAP